MLLENFVQLSTCYDPDCDAELATELQARLKCSLDEIYVVGDDNGEGDDAPLQLGASYFIQGLLDDATSLPTLPGEDGYIEYYEYNGVVFAMTCDHGYCNFFIAKSDIPKLPNMSPEDYKNAYED